MLFFSITLYTPDHHELCRYQRINTIADNTIMLHKTTSYSWSLHKRDTPARLLKHERQGTPEQNGAYHPKAIKVDLPRRKKRIPRLNHDTRITSRDKNCCTRFGVCGWPCRCLALCNASPCLSLMMSVKINISEAEERRSEPFDAWDCEIGRMRGCV